MFRQDDGSATSAISVGDLTTLESVGEVAAKAWDALVGDDDPFTRHAFLAALEESGAVGEGTGWFPRHLVLREGGELVGAMPLYLKAHSYGEYIFDWAWAEAAMSAGLDYYPKLVCAVPFTPAGAGRLLTRRGASREAVVRRLLRGAKDCAGELGASSVHLLFITDSEAALAEAEGFHPRLTYQFHWDNEGYESFDHYLNQMRSAVRKQIRRERRRAAQSGLRLATLDGPELDERHWRALYSFYEDTCSRKWGRPYLDQAFFERARATLAHDVVATLALDGTEAVAGALFFRRGRALYGRYWGARRDVDALHFELCYYRPIELCIDRGYAHFEAGAQGGHKLKRGLLPAPTHSAHWMHHAGLAQAIGQALRRERRLMAQEIGYLAARSPYRRG